MSESEAERRTDGTAARPGDGPPRRGTGGGDAGVTLIEVMVAIVVLAFGLLAVAGMAGAVAMQTRMGGNVTGQTTAGQAVLEELQTRGYDHPDLAAPGGDTRQVTVASHTYTVSYEVREVIVGELKEVEAVVESTRDLPPDTARTLVSAMGGPPPIP